MPKHEWLELFQKAVKGQGAFPPGGGAEALGKELAGCRSCDPRLGRRFRRFAGQLARRLGQTIPLVGRDWTNTKAAYRFRSNGRVNEAAILAGRLQPTKERFAAAEGPVPHTASRLGDRGWPVLFRSGTPADFHALLHAPRNSLIGSPQLWKT
ncbi:MAG: transposase DNA-binding-containing protein [Bryobacteraceae bacterium]